MKEDVTTFAVADPNGHGTPILYLVNPQSDMTPPTRERQTVQCAIGSTHCSDFWGDDVALQQHARPTASVRLRRTFRQADGQQIAASSEAGSVTSPAAPAGFESAQTHQQQTREALFGKGAAGKATEEAAKMQGVEKKKQDDEEEAMEEGDKQDNGQDNGPAGGEDKPGGSGTVS
ncbi:MAG: hypothetical protein GY832_19925 [Chloroflexi bacterium]|nr:hypothetical protein [Chloroflexota bacterium]